MHFFVEKKALSLGFIMLLVVSIHPMNSMPRGFMAKCCLAHNDNDDDGDDDDDDNLPLSLRRCDRRVACTTARRHSENERCQGGQNMGKHARARRRHFFQHPDKDKWCDDTGAGIREGGGRGTKRAREEQLSPSNSCEVCCWDWWWWESN